MGINEEMKSELTAEDIIELALENFRRSYQGIEFAFLALGFEARLEKDAIVVYDLEGHLIGTMSEKWAHGGVSLEIKTAKGQLTYTTVRINGRKSPDGKLLSHFVKLDSIEQINADDNNKKFTGRYIGIELSVNQINNISTPQIEVTVVDPNAEHIITNFVTNSLYFKAKLDSTYGPAGNNVDGICRSVSYRDYCRMSNIHNDLFNSKEVDFYGQGSYIDLYFTDSSRPGEGDFKLINTQCPNNNLVRTILPHHMYILANQLLTSPRSKNLIEYVLNSLDISAPGVRDYIMRNFSLMEEVEKFLSSNNYGHGQPEELARTLELFRNPSTDLECEKQEGTYGTNGTPLTR